MCWPSLLLLRALWKSLFFLKPPFVQPHTLLLAAACLSCLHSKSGGGKLIRHCHSMTCKAKAREGEKQSKTIPMTGLTTTDLLHFYFTPHWNAVPVILQRLSAHTQFPFLSLKVTWTETNKRSGVMVLSCA